MVRHLPPLNALRAFEAAARHLSFTKAATELHVTPAAISHQVKGLEAQLGTDLFRRLPRGLVLTDGGRALLPGLTDGFDRLARAADKAVSQGVHGRLSVSVIPSFAMCWLVPRLGDFARRYPEVDVDLRAETRNVDFANEEVDVGIRYGRGIYPGLRTDLIMTEEVYPVCSPALLNGPQPLRRLSDLQYHTLLHDNGARLGEPWIVWESWLKLAGLHGVDPARGPSFSDTTMILQAALMGRGIAIGRSALMESDLYRGRLVRPFDVSRPADYNYWVVSPEAAADTPKVVAFRDWLLEQAQAGPAPDLALGMRPVAVPSGDG